MDVVVVVVLIFQCYQLAVYVWQMKEEKSDVNLDLVKSTTPGLPGRAYSFVLIGRNIDQWRYCLELPLHDTSQQSTFKSQFCTKYLFILNKPDCSKNQGYCFRQSVFKCDL